VSVIRNLLPILARVCHQVPPARPNSFPSKADSVFYIQSGRIRLSVIAKTGKEATVALLGAGEFCGEECIASSHPVRVASAIAPSVLLKIDRKEMIRALHQEHSFSDIFVSHLLARNARVQEDLVDQLFNSSEKAPGPDPFAVSAIREGTGAGKGDSQSQEVLAEMVGTTLASQFLYEPLSKIRVHRVQRRH
jgi:CRP/FNR family cyclic AMP-dependent transcriptional regulator